MTAEPSAAVPASVRKSVRAAGAEPSVAPAPSPPALPLDPGSQSLTPDLGSSSSGVAEPSAAISESHFQPAAGVAMLVSTHIDVSVAK